MANKPFFIPEKEIKLFDAFNEELIDDIVGQTVDIYKVSLSDVEANIYGEASSGGEKMYDNGYQVNCLILFGEPQTQDLDSGIGADVNADIEMYFHRAALEESGFYPEIGDIVDWNGFYWEINGTTEPQLIGGHQNYKHQVKATAHRTRLTSANLEERPL